MKKFLGISLTLLVGLASCSTELPETDITITDCTTTGVVKQFTNGTAMTVGKVLATRASRTASAYAVPQNSAGAIDIEAAPSIPANAKSIGEYDSWQPGIVKNGGGAKAPIIIPNGTTYTTNGANIYGDIYVAEGGKLIVNNYGGHNTKVFVLPGGSMEWNSGLTLDRLQVYNYGDFSITGGNDFLVNQQGSVFKTTGDLNVPGKFSYGGVIYVGGKLNVGELNPYGASQIHVIGDANVTGAKSQFGTNGIEAVFEGSLVGNSFELNSAAKVWVGCKFHVKSNLYVTNHSELGAGYIRVDNEFKIDGGKVLLPANGLVKADFLNIADASDSRFQIVGGGKALIETRKTHMQESFDNAHYNLNEVIAPEFYFNYAEFTIPNYDPAQLNHDYGNNIRTSLVSAGINVAQAREWETIGCGEPSYAVPGETPENPNVTPEPEPQLPEQPNPQQPEQPQTPQEPEQPETEQPQQPQHPEPGQPGVPQQPETPTPPAEGGDLVEITIPHLENDWKLLADDFTIRLDGQYVADIRPVDNTVNHHDVIITENNLVVSVSDLQNLDNNHEYTYEVYLWIKPETWAAMDVAQKAAFINGADVEAVPTKYDAAKYEVRSNTFFGLSGQQDTPYVKISLHIVKKG